MDVKFSKKWAIAIGITLLPFLVIAEKAIANELLRVYMNHARILQFDNPVSSVIIGNSEVADVTVNDKKTVILTGKSYGSTNLVILDANGNALIDRRVIVSVDEENSIRVFRQVNRTVLSCAPACESQLTTPKP